MGHPQVIGLDVFVHRPGNVGGGDAQGAELFQVVFQDPLHGRSAGNIHLADPLDARQLRLKVFLGVLLDLVGQFRGIDRIDDKRRAVRTAGFGAARRNGRIRKPLGELRPYLPHGGGHLEAGDVHVDRLVELQGNIAAARRRNRRDVFHPLNTGQYGFEFGGYLALEYDPRSIAQVVRNRNLGQYARRTELDRKQGHQSDSHDRQGHGQDDDGKRWKTLVHSTVKG